VYAAAFTPAGYLKRWICEEHHTKYHDGKLGLFKNKLWWNPKRLLLRSMRNGMMPIKYQTLKSQFEKK
jgi:hypothetical protein